MQAEPVAYRLYIIVLRNTVIEIQQVIMMIT